MLSKDNSLKLKVLRDVLKLEQTTLALELLNIGFIFYLLQETVCKDKNSKTESPLLLLFFLKVRLFVWANIKGAISAQVEDPAGLMSICSSGWFLGKKWNKQDLNGFALS